MNHPWPAVPLREVLTERQEVPSKESLESGKVRIISKIGFNDGEILLRSDGETRTNMILIRPGDLVLSGINAAKGAVAIYGGENKDPIAATIHYGSYKVQKEKADIRFLWWLLRSQTFRDILFQNLPGGIKTELKAKRLLPIPVPLPPLPEQRRIVAKIEVLAAKVEEANKLRNQAIISADTLINSEIYHIFLRRTESNWDEGYLGDYVLEDCYGTSEKTIDDPFGIPILRMGNIQGGRLVISDLKYLFISDKERGKLILKSDDILVNRTNSAELVGKCAVFNLDGEYGFASYLIRLRLDLNRANPYLVAFYINSPIGRDYMFRERKQMTGQANVNAKKLKSLPIALPPLNEQHRIVSYLDGLQAQVEALKKLQTQTAAELAALLPAILDRAFKGEL